MFSSPPVLGLLFLMINITFYYCYFFPLEGPCAITWDRGMTSMLKKRGGILLAPSGQPLPRIRTSSWHHHSRSAVPPTSLGSDFSGWRKMRSLTKKTNSSRWQMFNPRCCSTKKLKMLFSWHRYLSVLLQATPFVWKKGTESEPGFESICWVGDEECTEPTRHQGFWERAEYIFHRKDSLIYP